MSQLHFSFHLACPPVSELVLYSDQKLTMYLLPTLWPPHNPTHRLAYAPMPIPTPPSSSSSVPASSNPFPTLIPNTPVTPSSTVFPSPRTYLHSAPPGARNLDYSGHRTTTGDSHASPSSRIIRPVPRNRNSMPSPRQSDTRLSSSSPTADHAQPDRPPSAPFPSSPLALALPTLTETDTYFHRLATYLPNYRPRDSLSTDRKYEMSMRQQPLQARMCSAGEKADRRPIDPPPIVQLKVTDTNGEDVSIEKEREQEKGKKGKKSKTNSMRFMHNPYYFLYATLVGSDEAQTELHVIEDGKTRLLTGTPVSSLYYLKDVNHRDAAFFVFPDLGVRKEGQYKLKLTLFEIVDQEVFYCATSFTDTFTVLSAKKFPGMQRATDLSKTFADQGLKIRVRKETKKRSSGIVYPPKNKRRSSITEEEFYNPKRPRPSLDSSYGSTASPYPSQYPQQVMPPPPVPHQPPRAAVHPPPPPSHPPPHGYEPSYGPPATPLQPSMELGGDYPRYPPSTYLPSPRKRGLGQASTRSEGVPFSGHPPGHQEPIPLPPPAPALPHAMPSGYPYADRDRQRNAEIQAAQRREIDARREAEARRASEARQAAERRAHQPQQMSRHEMTRVEKGYPEHLAYPVPPAPAGYQQQQQQYDPRSDHPSHMRYDPSPRQPSPSQRERETYSSGPSSAPRQAGSTQYQSARGIVDVARLEAHEREKRRMWEADQKARDAQLREASDRRTTEVGGYDSHGSQYRHQQYQYHSSSGQSHSSQAAPSSRGRPVQAHQGGSYPDQHQHQQHQHQQQATSHRSPYPGQYARPPIGAAASSYRDYPPQHSAPRDPRERQDQGRPEMGPQGVDTRRDSRDVMERQGDGRQSIHGNRYSTSVPEQSHRDRHPASIPLQHQPPTYSNSHFDVSHSRSLSTSGSHSARSTPQDVRTPQDLNPLPLPASHPYRPSPAKSNHYEPSARTTHARMRTDDWIEQSPRSLSLSFGSGSGSGGGGGGAEREKERLMSMERPSVVLPSIQNLTTPGHSPQGTPGTPASAGATVTPGGRDHRMGLGHLVD